METLGSRLNGENVIYVRCDLVSFCATWCSFFFLFLNKWRGRKRNMVIFLIAHLEKS